MSETVIRICDYERRSRNADACAPRDPCDADVIALPVIRIERHGNVVRAGFDAAQAILDFNRLWCEGFFGPIRKRNG